MDADAVVGLYQLIEGKAQSIFFPKVVAIGVIPAWRGRRVASALLGHALHLFQAEGLQQAALEVDTQNPSGALGLYEKHGFKAVRETIHFIKRLN
jgi:ribosomal protein S18 acetylase RimI-like enzyme